MTREDTHLTNKDDLLSYPPGCHSAPLPFILLSNAQSGKKHKNQRPLMNVRQKAQPSNYLIRVLCFLLPL